jgi:regulator of protease activity HflC (stomatin/prohibitin superfamily)
MQYLGIFIVVALILIAALSRSWTRVRLVEEHVRGVKYVRGRFAGVLEPGCHRYCPLTTIIRLVNIRTCFEVISGQEVLSTDGVSMRLSLVAVYRITDPHTVLASVDNIPNMAHTSIQIALREVVSTQKIAALLEQRGTINQQVLELARPRLAKYGVMLDEVSLRDLSFTGSLKRSFSLVLEAQLEAQAALERARGEQASLRSLANTARMLDNNPHLLQLRMLQMLGESKGHTIVFSGGPQSTWPPVIHAGPPSAAEELSNEG